MPAAPDPSAPLDSESSAREQKRVPGLPSAVRWLPDTSNPEFVAELQREAREIANCPKEAEEMDFVESISILFDDE